MPAPAAERIVDIAVHEGEMVPAGARVLTLEQVRGDAQLAAAQAEVVLRRQALAELRNGARTEDIEQARAHLAAATAKLSGHVLDRSPGSLAWALGVHPGDTFAEMLADRRQIGELARRRPAGLCADVISC